MGNVRRILWIALLLLSSESLASSLGPAEILEQYWRSFRITEPLLTQDVVASPIQDNGLRAVLITEPPPSVIKDRETWIPELFGKNALTHMTFDHQIGFDGSVQDIGILLQNVDDTSLSETVAALYRSWYGHDYKSSWRPFTPKSWDRDRPMPRRVGPPNLQISAASLNQWLFEAPLNFRLNPPDAGDPGPVAKLDKLFQNGLGGIFYSETPGLVILVLRRDVSLNSRKSDLHRFAIETDAILGAVRHRDRPMLAIVGRARTTSVDAMPPLRVETILTLAAAGVDDLAQSYERMAPLAGRVTDPELVRVLRSEESSAEMEHLLSLSAVAPNDEVRAWIRNGVFVRGVDWAPILLSRELTNTEYGQILNITDQMLKGWSLSNAARYAVFPYPAPDRYPYPEGILSHLGSKLGQTLTSLTFNWNTAGFGSWTNFGANEIFALNRTGALPISYIPEDRASSLTPSDESEIQKAEDEYWQFFADLRDPYLMRAAQYAALHVVFRRFSVRAQREEPLVDEASYSRRWQGLVDVTSGALSAFAATNPWLANTGGNDSGILSVNPEYHCMTRRPNGLANRSVELLRDASGNPEQLKELAKAITDPRASQAWITDALSAKVTQFSEREKQHNAEIARYNQAVNQCKQFPALCDLTQIKLRADRLEEEQRQLLEQWDKLKATKDRLDQDNAAAAALSPVLSKFGDCGAAWRAVRDAAPATPGSTHKTPTIVVSRNDTSVGGHNLDGRSVRIVGDPMVARGRVSINADGALLKIHPDDLPKSQDVARAFERDYKRFIFGDAQYRARIERRVASILSNPRPPVPFGATALGREPAAPGSLGSWQGHSRISAAPSRIEIPNDQLTRLQTYAKEHDAVIIVRKVEGGVDVIYPNGKPPLQIRTSSPDQTQQTIEALVERYSDDTAGSASSAVIVTDGPGISAGDLAAIKYSAEARSSASGGGNGKPPLGFDLISGEPPDRGWRRGFIFAREQENGNRRSRFNIFFLRGKNARLLRRTDADWAEASFLPTTNLRITSPTSGEVAVRLEVPFKPRAEVSENPFSVLFQAIFKKRKPTDSDVSRLNDIIKDKFALDGEQVGSKILSIRESFAQDFSREEIKVRVRIQSADDDFYVVEFDGNRLSVHRG